MKQAFHAVKTRVFGYFQDFARAYSTLLSTPYKMGIASKVPPAWPIADGWLETERCRPQSYTRRRRIKSAFRRTIYGTSRTIRERAVRCESAYFGNAAGWQPVLRAGGMRRT
jgi:hypothetical protein